MLYLVGVNHNIQRPFRNELAEYEHYSDEEKKKFSDEIKKQTIELDSIKFIAEEFSEDAKKNKLSEFSIDFTLLENLTKDIKLEHIFIDPSIKERTDLDIPIPDKTPFEKREKFWISKIQSKLDSNENGLVIIGLDHVETFPVLLKSKNISSAILFSEWNPD